jgi:hypothetical protein
VKLLTIDSVLGVDDLLEVVVDLGSHLHGLGERAARIKTGERLI